MTRILIHRIGTDLGGRSISPDAQLGLGFTGHAIPIVLIDGHRQTVVGTLRGAHRDGDDIWGDVEFFDGNPDDFTSLHLDFGACDFVGTVMVRGILRMAHVRIRQDDDDEYVIPW